MTNSLKFKKGQNSQKMRMETNKIGWIHSVTDKPGARFDLFIKDGFGRTLIEKRNCGNDTDKYGELIGLDTRLGEEVEIVVENIKNAENVEVFIN